MPSIRNVKPWKNWTNPARILKRRKQFLNDLPSKTSEAVEKLTSYSFENPDAEKEFQQLLMQLDQIRKLENWLRREGSLFRGQTPMDFQQSQEMMERMEELRRLEGQLSSMQLKDVDKELLEKLLGGDPKQDFEGVMRMQSLLEEGGYVLEQGERFELTRQGRAPGRPVGAARYLPAVAPRRHGAPHKPAIAAARSC